MLEIHNGSHLIYCEVNLLSGRVGREEGVSELYRKKERYVSYEIDHTRCVLRMIREKETAAESSNDGTNIEDKFSSTDM